MPDDLPLNILAREIDSTYQRQQRKRLGFVGDRSGTILVSGRDYHIYVRMGSLLGPVQVVYDAARKAPRIAGAPVELREREGAPGRYEVAGLSGTASPQIVNYANSPRRFEYGGSDVLVIDQRQIKQGLLRQNNPANMKVRVNAFTVYHNGAYKTFPEQETGTISAPAAGLARWDAISGDLSALTLSVSTGTAGNKAYPQTLTKPDFALFEMPLGFVYLDDQTTALKIGANIHPKAPYFTWNNALQFGTTAERTALAAVLGTGDSVLFMDTTEELLYYWSGAAWNPIGGGSTAYLLDTSGNILTDTSGNVLNYQ